MQSNQIIGITTTYIDNLMKDKNAIPYIKKNYEKLLNHISHDYITSVLIRLYRNKELQSFMDDKFDITLQKFPANKIETIISIYIYNRTPEEATIFLNEKLSELISKEDNIRFLYYLKFKNISKEIREKLNNRITKYKEDYIKLYIMKSEKYYWFDEEMTTLLEKLLQEILDHEQKDWIDIEYIDSGGYSHVYEIGSKVLKVGKERNSYKIPYHKRILQPLIRVDLSEFSKTNKGTLEVAEKVDTNIKVSEEELYEIYKELRDNGIIWTDTKQRNVGKLLKDNRRYWNKSLGQSKKAVGYREDEEFDLNEEVLRKGELVILDSDYIFLENDPHIQWGNPLATQFEERYQLEKNISKNKLK